MKKVQREENMKSERNGKTWKECMSNDCQSEYKLLKSNYDNINYISITEDENKLYFYTGMPTVAIFD